MSTTLTGLIPTLYAALDVVSRELIGFIPNVTMDAQASSAAVGQVVRSPVVPQAALEDITPGIDPANSGNQTIDMVDVTITKSQAYPIRWTGEQQLSVSQNGVVNTVLANQFTQGFRTLANAVEVDIGSLYVAASRAFGTAGTAPFGTANTMTDLAQMNKILDDNGAPQGDRVMIVNSTARAELEGKQSHLFKVNEAADAGALLRERELRRLMGFVMGYSAGVRTHVKGAGAGYLINNAATEAIGQTTLTVDGGTVNVTGIRAGDVITAAGDANNYIVRTGITATSGDIVIAQPGLLRAAADNAALTIGNNYVANMGYTRDAIILAARAPAMPIGGDAADDVLTLTDPLSGLSFQIALYRQYRQVKYEIGLSWGVAAVKPQHMAILMG